LPDTKTSIVSVIIASVKRQEEKLAKKEKDREYMRKVREVLREKAQEAKELAKMERKRTAKIKKERRKGESNS